MRGAWLRILRIPLVVFGVVTLLFAAVHLAPGDPASLILPAGLSQEVVDQTRMNYGLDQPLVVQYARWLGATMQGDLGYSSSANRPVLAVIGTLLPSTLLLVGSSMVLAFLLGITLGVWQARRAGGVWDASANVVALFFHSMPSFWLAIMLVLTFSLFASQAGWPVNLPASGTRSVTYEFMTAGEQLLDRLRHMILPVVTLVLVMIGGISRQVRSAVLEQLHSDHVRAARARGIPERTILRRNVLRNALLPIITLVGVYFPMMIGGAVFVETVFAWPGMGRALVTAVGARDYPLILGITLVVSVFVVVGSALADLLYVRADPRIRYE